MVESRPIDRHRTDGLQTGRQQTGRQQDDRSSQRPSGGQTADRHPDADKGARIVASNRRWEQSYGGARSDSHRWLRFR